METLKAVCPNEVSLQSLLLLCNYNSGYLCEMINECLSTLRKKPILSLLTHKTSPCCTFEKLFSDAEKSAEHIASLLEAILQAEVDSTFHKINIHAALTSADLETLLNPVVEQAQLLQKAFSSSSDAVPFVTVSIVALANLNVHVLMHAYQVLSRFIEPLILGARLYIARIMWVYM